MITGHSGHTKIAVTFFRMLFPPTFNVVKVVPG
jgi:hypothetical protein